MKITLDDLKSRGFKRKWLSDKSGYWYDLSNKNSLLGKVSILVESDFKTMTVFVKSDMLPIYKKPTLENLDKIIEFLKG